MESSLPIVAATLVAVIALTVIVVRFLLVVVPPDHVAVLSGRKQRRPDGREIGYRVVAAGRVVRMPLIEQVTLLSTAPIPISISLDGVYAKGGHPVSIALAGRVAIARTEPWLDNAVEHFLGTTTAELVRVARETVEGHVRGVAATLGPTEIGDQRFAQRVVESVEGDLQRLGLVLDGLTAIAPALVVRDATGAYR